MRNAILLLCVLVASGCNGERKEADKLIRYQDKENGVVCYQDPDEWKAFSCVKVSGGEHGKN